MGVWGSQAHSSFKSHPEELGLYLRDCGGSTEGWQGKGEALEARPVNTLSRNTKPETLLWI